jgi:hypothetical protein
MSPCQCANDIVLMLAIPRNRVNSIDGSRKMKELEVQAKWQAGGRGITDRPIPANIIKMVMDLQVVARAEIVGQDRLHSHAGLQLGGRKRNPPIGQKLPLTPSRNTSDHKQDAPSRWNSAHPHLLLCQMWELNHLVSRILSRHQRLQSLLLVDWVLELLPHIRLMSLMDDL